MHGLWSTAAITLAFAAIARWLRGVTTSGAVAGAVVCFSLYACAGPVAFLALVCVFVLTWGATRLGYSQKQRLGIAERRGGRNAAQVLANLAISGLCSGIFAYTHRTEWLAASVAALAEAAADTVSSEIGQASGRSPRLITSWQTVPPGTDGGISTRGTAAGVVAASLIAGVAVAGNLLNVRQGLLATAAGVAGMLADSVLGAWLERGQKLNNDGVNLLSTSIAAGIALFLG